MTLDIWVILERNLANPFYFVKVKFFTKKGRKGGTKLIKVLVDRQKNKHPTSLALGLGLYLNLECIFTYHA